MFITNHKDAIYQALRISIGSILIGLGFWKFGGIASIGGGIAMVIGIALLLSAIVNSCPMYRFFRKRSNRIAN